jgi:predicted transposase/invertase (TIGR01784 family)
MEALSRMPFTAQKEIFKQLEDYADSHRLTKKEWEAYENSLWVVRDNMACMAAAEREAREKGHAEGRAEGRAEEKKAIAKQFLAMGLTVEQVAQGSGLSIEEVKGLQ